MKTLVEYFTGRGLIVNLASLMLLVGGLYAAANIQREAFPSVNFDVLLIDATYLGASPRDVESRLVIPIERELKGLDGIRTIRSTAFQGTMQMLIEIEPGHEDRARLVAEVQQAIDRADLPAELPSDPLIIEVKSEQMPVLSFSVFGNLEPLALKRIGDDIEDDVLAIPGVAQVLVQGEQKEEIRIVLDPDAMARHRVSVDDVARLVRGWNVTAPGGRLRAPQGQSILRIVGEFRSAAEAADLVIRATERGDVLRLGDIAEVTETLERPRRLVAAEGHRSLNMIVLKRGGDDLLDLVDRVRAYLGTVPEIYPGIEVKVYGDFSTVTRLRLGVLTSNGAIGLVLVLAVLLLSLRPAIAITAAWSLPIIFFAGLAVLYLGGVTLNLLTMFAFIMVLGLLVDNAIIIGENVTWHMERGADTRRAVIAGATELVGPITATVLTTIVAFLPLMFMEGIIGKFVIAIPLVVVTLLLLSWLEALLMLPSHIGVLARARARPRRRRVFGAIESAYAWLLRAALRLRYLTVLLTVLALAGALVLAGQMRFQLFPPGAESQFYLRVTLPAGTALEETYDALLRLDAEVRARIDPAVLETTTIVAGENSADQRETMRQVGDRFGYVRVILTPFNYREVSAHAVMNRIQSEIPPLFPALAIGFEMEPMGPPVGRALQVEITARDGAAREAAARRLIALLGETQGVYAVESDLEPGDPELRIELDRALAAWAGIDLATVATHVRAAFDGLPVSTLIRGKDEVDVTLRFPDAAQRDIDALLAIGIPAKGGGLVPLGRIAHVEEAPGAIAVRRKDGDRVVTVTAEVDPRHITSQELNAMVRARAAEWTGGDARVGFMLGGEQERAEESVAGLVFSFGFALLGIFAILAIQFNRLSWPLLVMLAIPFGIIGVVVGFWLNREPLSFMALMGFVALSGVVVNASLVMSVFIQRLIAAGRPWRDAVVEAGRRRLRAVILTTVTTVAGLLPTAYGWGGHDPFVAPMALALSWGLIFSTFITLFTVPATLGIGMDVKAMVGGLTRIVRAGAGPAGGRA